MASTHSARDMAASYLPSLSSFRNCWRSRSASCGARDRVSNRGSVSCPRTGLGRSSSVTNPSRKSTIRYHVLASGCRIAILRRRQPYNGAEYAPPNSVARSIRKALKVTGPPQRAWRWAPVTTMGVGAASESGRAIPLRQGRRGFSAKASQRTPIRARWPVACGTPMPGAASKACLRRCMSVS